ncbi:hypothetical protein E5K21_002549 [Enterococcus faecalis]|uniref:hypothetical protein n=1 Tax=Enterococcus faecalis TaxID=1351 RepID=UPI001A0E3F66|nr:hypothetical protein [Enterococcus faecalis]EGO8197355.1 hypothetical protein [Enterococcus faecalis]MBX8942287.1 hypothetical protein [Enterococcus faecalis]
MKIIMNEACVKENLGEVMLLGVTARHPYNETTREYDESIIDSITANLACTNLDNSITVQLEEKEIPNVKRWGKVRVAGLVYTPSATANSFEDRNTGKSRSYGSINDRFTAIRIEALTPTDRKADENGQIVNAIESKENKEAKK